MGEINFLFGFNDEWNGMEWGLSLDWRTITTKHLLPFPSPSFLYANIQHSFLFQNKFFLYSINIYHSQKQNINKSFFNKNEKSSYK